jgi:ammonia channel protein AmtB
LVRREWRGMSAALVGVTVGAAWVALWLAAIAGVTVGAAWVAL